jgi:regulator of RNase E activity RraB
VLDDADAIFAWKHHVEDDDVEVLTGDEVDAFISAMRYEDAVAIFDEALLEDMGDALIVFDHQ